MLDSLKADDLVNSDKIGAGNFFWSFPSKTHQIVIHSFDIAFGKSSADKIKDRTTALNKSRFGKIDSIGKNWSLINTVTFSFGKIACITQSKKEKT